MNKDKSTTREAPSFEPPAIRVLARFEKITLGASGTKAEPGGFKAK